METKALVPVSDIREMAKAVVASKLFPVKNEAEAFTLMMIAQAEGCHPIQAMQRYDIIQGRPAKKAQAMLSDFQMAGGKVTWHERSDAACEAEFTGPGLSQPVRVRWTMDDARRAGLTGKENYKKYPRQMLSARVISEGVGVAWAGARSLYTPEEVQDFDDKRPVVVQSPAPAIAAIETPHDPETGEVIDAEIETSAEPFEDSVECWRWDKHGQEWISRGHEPKANHKQVAYIHLSYQKLKVTEAKRRERLQQLYNKESTAQLSVSEASDCIDRLNKALETGKGPEGKVMREERKMASVTADMDESLRSMGMGDLAREPGED